MGREKPGRVGRRLSTRTYFFKLTVLVSGLKLNCIVRSGVTPGTVGNGDVALPPLLLGAMPAGKYCLLVMLTCVGPLTKPVTR